MIRLLLIRARFHAPGRWSNRVSKGDRGGQDARSHRTVLPEVPGSAASRADRLAIRLKGCIAKEIVPGFETFMDWLTANADEARDAIAADYHVDQPGGTTP
ncbi:MAG: hypothetical protein V3R98_14980 [Alphaproteobacteria bacterium]